MRWRSRLKGLRSGIRWVNLRFESETGKVKREKRIQKLGVLL